LVGVGEASYSCIAPTLIGDLFTNSMRTKMLGIFYLAVPVGSGLGYIVGSNIAKAFSDWRWALRFTPPIGLAAVILLIFFVQEPKRGGAENSNNYEENKSSILSDLIYLVKNKTFMWTTAGFTFASFVLGGLSWWVPLYVEYAFLSNNIIPEQISLKFGIITCFSGLLGVGTSSILATQLRKHINYADALVCAIGSLITIPTLFIAILITRSSVTILYWISTGIAITSLCLSWTMVADILLYVIHPNKRSTASAFNILVCHLFGDAGSPYIIGAVSFNFFLIFIS
jgi:MFS transporter, Spinster family, sphingosine-1-phosphate transporter